MNKFVFNDNVVIITGASKGIGKELALQLADQGAWLALAARDATELHLVADRIACRIRGSKALVVPTDVTESAQCENLIAQTVKEYGRIDTLINNAGMGMWAMFEDVRDLSIYERLMRVNYLGSVYCTFYALPHLKESRGRIVGVSSLAGKTGVPTRSGYTAAKAAMGGFFETLRVELTGTGVTVTMAFPDFVATGIRARNLGADGKPLGKDPSDERGMMSVQSCARLILQGAAKQDREIIMTLRGKIGQWIKLIAPGLVDRIALDAVRSVKKRD